MVAAPIFDDTKEKVIGAVTVLLRRDTMFHSVADVTIGSTGHAMLFTSDGIPVICPILAPEEHSVRPELISAGGVQVRLDRGGRRFAWRQGLLDRLRAGPVQSALAPGSIGGKQWVTVVRQDPKETFAPLADLIAKVLLYGSRAGRAVGNRSLGSATDRPAHPVVARRRAGNRQRTAGAEAGTQDRGRN